MACNCTKCNSNKPCGCLDPALTNPCSYTDCCDGETCEEISLANCVSWPGPDICEFDIKMGDRMDEIVKKLALATSQISCVEAILCDTDEIVSANTPISEALALISNYFCTKEEVLLADLLCGVDVIALQGATLNETFISVVEYFCNKLANIATFKDASVSFVDVEDPSGCVTRTYTVTYFKATPGNFGFAVDTIVFSTPPICPDTIISLTTTGTSGPSTLTSGVLNVPDYDNGFVHYLGEDFENGIIFHLWKDNAGVEHGLIVNKTQPAGGIIWEVLGTLTGANRDEDGAFNTTQIPVTANSPLATTAATYPAGWYIPAIDELNLLHNNRFHVQGVLRTAGFPLLSNTSNYWSSRESTAGQAWTYMMGAGTANGTIPKTQSHLLRMIRSF